MLYVALVLPFVLSHAAQGPGQGGQGVEIASGGPGVKSPVALLL